MTRPRLCMVVHAHYPLGEPRVQREARAARAAGYAVEVLCLRGSGEPRREFIDEIDIHRLPLRHRRGAGAAAVLVEYLGFFLLALVWLAGRSAARRFEIIHFHNPPDFLVAAGLLPRLRGARLILDVHDLSPHIFSARVGGKKGRLVSHALTWIEVKACRLVDRVVTVHEPYRTELARHGVPAHKISVVMNSLDPEVLAGARRLIVKQPKVRFTVAYHGTITRWYGTDLILEALAYLRERGIDAGGLILGAGDEVDALRERARELQLESAIEIPGQYVPIEQALARVANADVGVIPNRPTEINRFALSSKLFEYVALELPVVVSRLDTLANHFSEEEVSFFEPGDARDLARALAWVHEHPNAARTKVQKSLRRAECYTWQRSRHILLEAYASARRGSDSAPATHSITTAS